MRKKLLCLVMSLLMIVSVVAGMSVTVNAQDSIACEHCSKITCKTPEGIHSADGVYRKCQAISLNGNEVGYYVVREIGYYGSNYFTFERCDYQGVTNRYPVMVRVNFAEKRVFEGDWGDFRTLQFEKVTTEDGIYFKVNGKTGNEAIKEAAAMGMLWEMDELGLRFVNTDGKTTDYYMTRYYDQEKTLSTIPAVTIFKHVNACHDWTYEETTLGHVVYCKTCGQYCVEHSGIHTYKNGSCTVCGKEDPKCGSVETVAVKQLNTKSLKNSWLISRLFNKSRYAITPTMSTKGVYAVKVEVAQTNSEKKSDWSLGRIYSTAKPAEVLYIRITDSNKNVTVWKWTVGNEQAEKIYPQKAPV